MRPKLVVAKRPIDHIIDYVGNVAVAFMIALPIMYWNELPEIVPSHFDFSGQPDAYSGKWIVITLPLIGIILFAGLRWLVKKPHLFNYPTTITEENAQAQYQMATTLVNVLNTVVACIFAYLTYAVIHTALGNMSGPGTQFIFLMIFLTLGIPLAYLVVASRKT